MSERLVSYQCPNCTGPLRFDGASGQVKCDFCGTSFETADIETMYAELEQAAIEVECDPEWNLTMLGQWSDEESANLRSYNCPSCTAQLVSDASVAAKSCPYCGNPTIIPGQLSGVLRPDFIIPFKLDRAQATAALGEYYGGKRFLPDCFASGNRIEDISGIYVPFWLFDANSSGYMRFRGTKVRRYTTSREEITETSHFQITRKGHMVFERIPVDGSTKMPDAHMEAIEPFDYKELQQFSTIFLPGFLADRYDLSADECVDRANDRIRSSTQDALRATVSGYATLSQEHCAVNIAPRQVSYALMPVWLLSTKWQGENYTFAMNGQTGKMAGNLPIDTGKYWKTFATIMAVSMAIVGAVCFILV